MKNLKLVYMQKRKSIKMQHVPPLLLTLHWELLKKNKQLSDFNQPMQST